MRTRTRARASKGFIIELGVMGKGQFSIRRRKKGMPPLPLPTPPVGNGEPTIAVQNSILLPAGTGKASKKKVGGARLWMRFDRWGQSELNEWDKNAIIKRAAIPARDLRILGPIFSHSSSILGNNNYLYVFSLLINLFTCFQL